MINELGQFILICRCLCGYFPCELCA